MSPRSIARHSADPDRAVLETAMWPLDAAPERLDRAAMCLSAFPTRQSTRKAARRGELAVDGEVSESSRWVEPGQTIAWLEPETPRHRPLPISIAVVYEDDVMAVVLKPAGLVTMGPRGKTLERALPHNLTPSRAADGLAAPRPVHRLDAPTSGLVVIAKTRAALAALGHDFERRRIHKGYRALVVGALEGEGVIDEPVDGRQARTRYRGLATSPCVKSGHVSRLDAFPETGRTHQIRRHLASIGHPILGDRLYGQKPHILRGNGLFLFAVSLELAHPTQGHACTFAMDEPPKVASFVARERRRVARLRGDAT
ncbi:MAG: RluA family pseudouridine synthase [Myxococcota bacterium]